MTSSRANRPNTPADILLRECLVQPEKQNFLMVAGAGSGKTTSLIKALSTILTVHGKSLKTRRQRVACITYTEIAAGEIWSDVGNNPLVHVSTIHSFLWSVARSFQRDIREWVLRRIDERIADLEASAAAFGPRVQSRTREKNQRDTERYRDSKDRVGLVGSFIYGTGSDYPKGILGHDDVIRMATDFMRERELFRSLLAQQFPFVFIDESQDTQDIVVQAFIAVASQAGTTFCLGFFGDPMQRIYPTGIGKIPTDGNWQIIDKEENFRCPTAVLSVANAIRSGGDDLVQIGGRRVDIDGVSTPVEGSARIFVLQADERRDERLSAIRDYLARVNEDPEWNNDGQASVKILVIVHRMAAKRLGFGNLYAAMNDRAPTSFSDGFLDATSWPLRPFQRFIMPLAEAVISGNEFEAMSILRSNSPLLAKDRLRDVDVAAVLARLRSASQALTAMVEEGSGATVRDALTLLRDEQMLDLDTRLVAYLENGQPDPDEVGEPEQDVEPEKLDEASREMASMDLFLACPLVEFRGFRQYFAQQSPFATQQGIKGTEFERVLVVLDDDEGTHVQFSYDKFFGVKALSPRDEENIQAGKETTIERTRRLFYVCCTRALTDLVVVYFSNDPVLAKIKVQEMEIFEHNCILDESELP